jgi:hypothetical protein
MFDSRYGLFETGRGLSLRARESAAWGFLYPVELRLLIIGLLLTFRLRISFSTVVAIVG